MDTYAESFEITVLLLIILTTINNGHHKMAIIQIKEVNDALMLLLGGTATCNKRFQVMVITMLTANSYALKK
jgi:hypothetical protein